jgi:AraC-like DNA-binding protein
LSVSFSVVVAAVDAVVRTGKAPSDVLERLKLDARRLGDLDGRIELEEFGRVLADCAAITEDPAFGLRLVEQLAHGAMGLVTHFLSHAPTLREGVAMATRFADLTIEGHAMTGRDEGDAFVVDCTVPQSTAWCHRTLTEMTMTGVVRMASMYMASRVVPRRACFDYPRPPYQADYQRIFGPDQRFSQKNACVVFDRDIADRPQRHHHPELYGLLRTEAERALERVATGSTPADRVRRYLLAAPHQRVPEMATTARELGLSERSLRRQLAAAGTTYRDLVRAELESSATRLLRESPRTIKEIATELGFLDAAAFSTAFKRWTGVTPGQYRRQSRLS